MGKIRHLGGLFLLCLLVIPAGFCIDNTITKPDEEDHPFSATINVNTGTGLGNFKMVTGANCGPHSTGWNSDYSSIYNDLGITIIRTHDYYGPCDWYTIFPDWDQDADNPASYDFASSDQVIRNIKQKGFEVFFRLGPSWNDPVNEHHSDPPGTLRDNQGNITHQADQEDFNKFALICKNIVRHYNEGWAKGYFYGIKRWEIWNEPSLPDRFWKGTAPQFYAMFATVFTTLKIYDSSLVIGGPGLAGHSNQAYEVDLIAYCQNNGIQIDFFSWHSYGNEGGGGDNAVQSPAIIGDRADYIRGNLDSHNFNATDLICSEWNADLGNRNFTDSGKGAAFFAGALIVMEDQGVSENYLYRGDDHPLGIMKDNGDLKTGAYTLQAWKSVITDTERVFVTNSDLEEFYAVASRSGNRATVWIMLANYSPTDHNIRLVVNQLDTVNRTQWMKTDWEISDLRPFTIVSGPDPVSHSGGKITLEISISKESVRLIRLVGLGG